MRPKQIYSRTEWSPGLVTSPGDQLDKDGLARVADNVDITKPGILRRRMGWHDIQANFSATSDPTWTEVSYLDSFELGVGERQHLPGPPSTNYSALIAIKGKELWQSTQIPAGPFGPDGEPPVNSTYAWTKIGNLSVRAGDSYPLNQDSMRPSMAKLNRKLYIAKGYGGVGGYGSGEIGGRIDSWDTVTYKQGVLGGPTASFIFEYMGALICIGVNGQENRMIWSGTAGETGPDVWPANNFVDIAPGDGDRLSGLAEFNNSLYILKRSSIWRITGALPDNSSLDEGDSVLTKIGGQVHGSVNPRCVASTPFGVVWLSWNGVYLFDGNKSTELTERVREIFVDSRGVERGIIGGALYSRAHYDKMTNIYRLTLGPSSTNPDLPNAIEINLSDGSISAIRGSLSQAYPSTRYKDLEYIGFHDGKIGFRGDYLTPGVAIIHTTSDNGKPIEWEYKTTRLPMSPENERKVTRIGRVLGNKTTEGITVQMLSDFDPTHEKGIAEVDFDVDSDSTIINQRVNLTNVGRDFQLVIKGDGTDIETVPAIHSVTVEYERLGN